MVARALDHPLSLVPTVGMLAGCAYYECSDTLKKHYLPKSERAHWVDATTLEIDLGEPLADPSEVDPRRFALLREQSEAVAASYYCDIEICYRELDDFESIPESLSWDPESPSLLRLHFADPVPAGACEPWPGTWADLQALSLVYFGKTLFGFEPVLPDMLQLASGGLVEAIGPWQAIDWRRDCLASGACEFDDFCELRGNEHDRDRLWVACP